jgi:hypothetical protein
MEKICFKCDKSKPLDCFYKHKQMSDGYLGKCKECTKNDIKIRTNKLLENPEWVEKEQTRQREKYYRLEYKDLHKPDSKTKKEQMNRYINKYPEKKMAKQHMGKMKPLIKGNNLHHWSYNDIHFKDIIELTVAKHNFIHRFLVYNQEFKMYQRKDTLELLDSKEKHLKYINSLKE